MSDRVTIQDIADALGLSRNTVSKAINNTGTLADSTRDRVLKKATEMGYKQFSYIPFYEENLTGSEDARTQSVLPFSMHAQAGKEEIAVFSGMFLGNSHFGSSMLDKFQKEITSFGYSMSLHRVLASDRQNMTLPLSFNPERTSGIICIEIFDYNYCKMVCDLGIPVLMVDAPVATYGNPLDADVLLMENTSAIYRIISDAKKKGFEKVGFIGEATHCRSFFERYMAFRNAMYLYSLPIEEQYCITGIHPDNENYRRYLQDLLSKLNHMPDLWICANDFAAIDVMSVLSKLNCYCPDDYMVLGFDDSPDSRRWSPEIATVHIHSQITGYSAAHLLLSRIQQPDLNYRTIYTETNLIYRESTKCLIPDPV